MAEIYTTRKMVDSPRYGSFVPFIKDNGNIIDLRLSGAVVIDIGYHI